MTNTDGKRMSKKDQETWKELYEYVRTNIMGYDKNQSLSRNMVLRLKGLLNNKFMANNNMEDTANYSFEVVLNTFRFCSPDIKRGLRNGNFKDENHKFNYILKIVESNLNNVYMRMKRAEKAKEEIKSENVNVIVRNDDVVHEPKKKNEYMFEDLW